MTLQTNERTTASLRLAAPGAGITVNAEEVEQYLEMVAAGVIVSETACDKGMQDNFALRAGTSVELATV